MHPLGPPDSVIKQPGSAEVETAQPGIALTDVIRRAIEEEAGNISFARYMELALYEPRLGYYSTKRPKFGVDGDFITAPELSSLFARCLARQVEQVLGWIERGSILEVGAGGGRLASDLLMELEKLDRLPQHYWIFEISRSLRERQRATLEQIAPHLLSKVSWLDRLPYTPFSGVVIANEVLDALPVHRFCLARESINELRVGWCNGRLVWSDSIAAQGELRACVQAVLEEQQEPLPVGYTSEVNLNVKPWFAELGASFVQGVVFCIDYGYPRAEYYHPQRVDGTLMCHYRHRAHTDPLILVGQQDITAFVDFTAVTEAGTASGFELAGYATQAHFLMGCGLGEVLRELQDTVPDRYSYYADHAKYLTLPGEMGERFKVIALAKGSLGPLIGFRRFDQRDRLKVLGSASGLARS